MKKLILLISISFLLVGCKSTQKAVVPNTVVISNPIKANIDLTKVVDDKVPVTIDPGKFNQDSIVFRLPKVIQGTYALSNFGKHIEGLKALDYDGAELEVSKIDDNSWSIQNATNFDKLTYLVNDTFDQEVMGGIGQEIPFSPAGTNIDEDNFVLNLHGFVGYFDSLINNQYELDVVAPATFKRISALPETGLQSGPLGRTITTSYSAARYFEVTDNPMMYGNLDVEEFQVGDVKVVLSVYSPNKVHSAKTLKDAMFKMMEAQKDYLGDLNTTSRYDIFLYLSTQGEGAPKGFGALEHHRSTVVVYPEGLPAEALAQSLTDTVSHEFFHIVSPLTLHSEDVHYFNYNDPTFSKHLWLYEGVTEYFSDHFQINKELISEDDFYIRLLNKVKAASGMNDTMSFTEMSENVLDQPYSGNYLNVYQKGALIGMCIDILLREESDGNRGILNLMKQLSSKYGVNRPFEDDKFIDEITAMTFPRIGEFFKNHVIGSTPIDYNKFFKKVGLRTELNKVETNYIMNDGVLILQPDMASGTIGFADVVKDNSFWNEQGAKGGDIIKEINGEAVSLQNAQQVFTKVYMWQPGTDIEVKLDRNGEEIVIKAETTQSYTTGRKLVVDEASTTEQQKLRSAWLKG
ncbi:MAG: peptidase M61 [Bacteroidia bacterium]|nr:peptidase M61 [Bacteroidia bacterium]